MQMIVMSDVVNSFPDQTHTGCSDSTEPSVLPAVIVGELMSRLDKASRVP